MNRTIKEATVKTYYYDSHEQLRHQRLKTLVGPMPYQFICSRWQKEPNRSNQTRSISPENI